MGIKKLVKDYSEARGIKWNTHNDIDVKFLEFCKKCFVGNDKTLDVFAHEYYGLRTIEHIIIESNDHTNSGAGFVWKNWILPNLKNKNYVQLFESKRLGAKAKEALTVNESSITQDNVFKYYNMMILRFICYEANPEKYFFYVDRDFAFYIYTKLNSEKSHNYTNHFSSFMSYYFKNFHHDAAVRILCQGVGFLKSQYYLNLKECLMEISTINNEAIEDIVINDMGYGYFTSTERQQVVDLCYSGIPQVEASLVFNKALNVYESRVYGLSNSEILALIEPLITVLTKYADSFSKSIDESTRFQYRQKLSLALLDKNRLSDLVGDNAKSFMKAYLIHFLIKDIFQPVVDKMQAESISTILNSQYSGLLSYSSSYEVIMDSLYINHDRDYQRRSEIFHELSSDALNKTTQAITSSIDLCLHSLSDAIQKLLKANPL